MNPITLAISFIRVPKLFVSLLLWPLAVGLGVAIFQAMASSAYFGIATETPEQFQKRVTTDSNENMWFRKKLFGTDAPLPPPQICYWQTKLKSEVAVGNNCPLEPLDIVIRPGVLEDHQIAQYQDFFLGSAKRIHVCETCESNITIKKENNAIVSSVHGLVALGVYALTDSAASNRVSGHFIDAKKDVEKLKDLVGELLLHPNESATPINMSQATKMMILIMNVALITITALWLSLRGHRKVLDYFARNGALLPLVAACGKKTFYTSLWFITLFRVAFFLLAALPTTVILMIHAVPEETLKLFIGSPLDFILWIAGIITSLSLLSIIASIAELKHRHSWISFSYRYIPLIFCVLGTVLWFGFLFSSGPEHRIWQHITASIPIVGISPILVSPLFSIPSEVIAAHALLSSVLVLLMLKRNSQWFAAHLEEI